MESSVEIDAPAQDVWETYTDLDRWPEWTPSVERIVPLDGPDVAVGRRVEIKQPRFPKLVWEITEVTPGRAWTWVQRSPGGTTVAWHEIAPDAGGRSTRVRLGVEQSGPVGSLVGQITRRLTRRYLDAEALGLKGRCEQSTGAPGGR